MVLMLVKRLNAVSFIMMSVGVFREIARWHVFAFYLWLPFFRKKKTFSDII